MHLWLYTRRAVFLALSFCVVALPQTAGSAAEPAADATSATAATDAPQAIPAPFVVGSYNAFVRSAKLSQDGQIQRLAAMAASLQAIEARQGVIDAWILYELAKSPAADAFLAQMAQAGFVHQLRAPATGAEGGWILSRWPMAPQRAQSPARVLETEWEPSYGRAWFAADVTVSRANTAQQHVLLVAADDAERDAPAGAVSVWRVLEALQYPHGLRARLLQPIVWAVNARQARQIAHGIGYYVGLAYNMPTEKFCQANADMVTVSPSNPLVGRRSEQAWRRGCLRTYVKQGFCTCCVEEERLWLAATPAALGFAESSTLQVDRQPTTPIEIDWDRSVRQVEHLSDHFPIVGRFFFAQPDAGTMDRF